MSDQVFNVGDKVRIREWDDMLSEYGIVTPGGYSSPYIEVDGVPFTEIMRRLCGCVCVVASVENGHIRLRQSRKTYNSNWMFTAGMLEPYARKRQPPAPNFESLMKVLCGEASAD